MRLAFIGYGNMSSALIGGISSSKNLILQTKYTYIHNKKE